jgi:hypothetical protein
MDERRSTPRASCRLHGRVRQKRGQLRVRIVDVSEGGLCLFTPVAFEAKSKIEVEIDVPGFPDCIVQAEVWHVHRQKGRDSSRKIWSVGAMLDKSDDSYVRLLAAAGVAPDGPSTRSISGAGSKPASASSQQSAEAGLAASPSRPSEDFSSEDELEARIFRVRVQSQTGPRTRLLTFTADSRADAESMAIAALQPEWRVIEVIVA